MLITQEVEVLLHQKKISYYENLGYDIPRVKNERGEYIIPKGTTIKVKVEDLPENSHYPVKVKCDYEECGKEYEIEYSSYAYGQKFHPGKVYCRPCISKVVIKKDKEYFIAAVNEKYGDGTFTILGDYKGNKVKTLIRHNKCIDGGINEFLVKPNAFLIKETVIGCPKCARISAGDCFRKSQEEFENEVRNVVGDEYTVLGKYIKRDKKILMRHEICGHAWMVQPDNFLSSTRCPNCYNSHKSKGEDTIKKVLNKYNVNHMQQFLIEECRYKNALPFDFAVFSDQEKTNLLCLIEFQGIQHYIPQRFGGISQERAEENLKYVQNNDRIKKEYCEKEKIDLIIIPYTEKKNIKNTLIENIVKKYNISIENVTKGIA